MCPHTNSKKSGFAIVIALSLMAFVLLLLLSMTTLIKVEQSSASTSRARLEAEQNALLALTQALGTLQAELGPDQRISANADIFDDSRNDNAGTVGTVAHPYLVGVWDTSGDKQAVTVAQRSGDRWEIGDTINYQTKVQNGFRKWLVLDDEANALDSSSIDLASNTTFGSASSANSFKAVGAGTLQPNGGTFSGLQEKEIWAPLKDLYSDDNNTVSARIGWVVLDEGVKARMNQNHQLAAIPSPSTAEALIAWDNAGNVGIEAMGSGDEFEGFDRGSVDSDKVFSFSNASLFMGQATTPMDADDFGPYFHDISLHSSGVMADVVNGGLKRDLTTLAAEEPIDYTNRFLYSDTNNGHADNPNADPRWSAILDYIGLYKDSTRLKAGTGGGLPVAMMNTNTNDWDGVAGSNPSIDVPLPAPRNYRLTPAVAQFETYFSLMALIPNTSRFITNLPDTTVHPYYNPRGGVNINENNCRMLNLCITPVITLYNPYNVPIEFGNIWVSFRDIPVGMRFSYYDYDTDLPVPMTSGFVPPSAMYSWSRRNVDGNNFKEQRFVLELQAGSGRIRTTQLAPGESIVFAPSYPDDTPLAELVNWDSTEQIALTAQPGYSEGIGLFWDAFIPDNFRVDTPLTLAGYEADGSITRIPTNIGFGAGSRGTSQIFMNAIDRVQIELAFADGSQNPPVISADGPDELERAGTFSIELYSEDPGIGYSGQADSSASKDLIGRYTFDYNQGSLTSTSTSDRENLLEEGLPIDHSDEPDNQVIAQVELAHGDFDLPNIVREGGDMDGRSINGETIEPGDVGDIDPHVFASFRVGGKVTQQTTGEPFQPAVASALTNTTVFSGHVHIGEESPSFTNYNLYINRPLDGIGEVAPTTTANDGGYFFSGYDPTNGTPYGTQLEVPVTPLQSIAALQHANVAASGYLPQVSHVVGNSFAHPLIGSDEALTTGTATYGLFDHSYIANTRLWDSYYFSTLADQGSALDSSGDNYYTTVTDFFTNEPLPNPTFKFHLPEGSDVATATAELTNRSAVQADAYLKAAAYQLQDGSFNINSTSVEAWKAILATTNIANSLVRQPYYYNPESNSTAVEFSPESTGLAAVYSRFRIPNYNQSLEDSLGNIGSGGSLPSGEDFAIWQGYRQLDETTINQLANDIVDQIRYRGPFLSLADFVNRRLGAQGDSRTLMGAIDAAIAENTAINDGLTTAAGEDISSVSSHITSNASGMISNLPAVSGNTARGVPSYLTQADILQQIGSRLSARSDTFVIRAYGEVVNPLTREVSASSICEAVVQRIPDYVDSEQEPYFDTNPSTIAPDGLSETNERFGRKFKIVQLNWLDPNDV